MALDWASTTNVAAAGAMLVLAGWLLWLDFSHRLARAFGLVLLLRAGQIMANQYYRFGGEADISTAGLALRGYLDIALAGALASFLIAYCWPRGHGAATRARWAVLITTLALETSYFLDHCSYRCIDTTGATFGPLSLVGYPWPGLLGVVGIVLALGMTRELLPAKHRSLVLASLLFAMTAMFEAGLRAIALVSDAGTRELAAGSGWSIAANAAYVSGLLTGMIAFLMHAAQHTERLHRLERAMWLAVLLTGSLIVVEFGSSMVGLLVIGGWRLLLPCGLAFAIVRYRLFGFDKAVRASMGRGAVATSVVLAFFIVSETIEAVFRDWTGSVYVGLAASGLVLIATRPLAGLGHRLAGRMVPGLGHVEAMPAREQRRLFAEQAEIAWSDGVLTARERAMLTRLRQRLGLPDEEANRIEASMAPARRKMGVL